MDLTAATRDATQAQSGLDEAVPTPPAIQVEGLSKAFAVPGHRETTLKAQLLKRSKRRTSGRLQVLNEISFEVGRGEFFGIVGRNGSGKSTLLKLLAGIYRADAGTIRVARLAAPVIELGVGFQAELPARENVILNAEMMGLPTGRARACFDDVIHFAELEDFVDLKLKNYSSGMRVRLAFAIAMQIDADVLLLDEVLAVGDEAFQRKCENEFNLLKVDPTKTVVLVTHSMQRVRYFCDRALLLEKGRIEEIGDPDQVAQRYSELMLSRRNEPAPGPGGKRALRIDSVRLDGDGEDLNTTLESGEEIRVGARVVAEETVEKPDLRLEIRDTERVILFAPIPFALASDKGRLEPGESVQVETSIENRLAPGVYTITLTGWGSDGVRLGRVSRTEATSFTVLAGSTPFGAGKMVLDYKSWIAERTGPKAGSRAQSGRQ